MNIIVIMCLRICVCMCVCVREREGGRKSKSYTTTPYRQVSGLPDVQIWGKLYYVNDHATSINHDWHIHNDRVYTPTPLRLVSECNDLKFVIILWKSVATDSLSPSHSLVRHTGLECVVLKQLALTMTPQ